MKPVNNYSSLIRPLKRPLNRRPAQAAQKPNSPRREQNGDRLHINPQVKSIDTLRASFKEYNYRAIQAHSSELLLKLALEDSRFALQAHKELLRRKDYNTVSTIANHYCDIKTKDIFDGILSDWLEKGNQDLKDVARNLLLGNKINELVYTLASQNDLKTIAKILNFYENFKTVEDIPITSWMAIFRSILNHDQLNALAKLLNPINKELAQSIMLSRPTNRTLNDYLYHFNLNINYLESLCGRKSNPRILLIGGGESPIKQMLNGQEIPIHITNVDPIKYTNPENTADCTINEDFLTADIVGKFDEIWCLFSLPYYLVNPIDVNNFYKKALDSLADEGVLRIYPIKLVERDSLSFKERLLKPLVDKESQKELTKLENNDSYIINTYNRAVTIQKKPQTTEVLS